MGFYDEIDEIDMRIDYEENWEHNAKIELERLFEELLNK